MNFWQVCQQNLQLRGCQQSSVNIGIYLAFLQEPVSVRSSLYKFVLEVVC